MRNAAGIVITDPKMILHVLQGIKALVVYPRRKPIQMAGILKGLSMRLDEESAISAI